MQPLRWLCAEDVPSYRGLGQRAAYQRIIVLAWIVVLTAAMLFAWYIDSWKKPELPPTMPVVSVHDVYLDSYIQSPARKDYPPGARNLPAFAQHHEGFMGFGNLRVIRDEISGDVPTPERPEFPIYDTRATTEYEPEIPLSFSPVSGTEYVGVIIPENVESFFSEHDTAVRDCVRPPVPIQLPLPQYPLLEKTGLNREAFVQLCVCVDADGMLTKFRESESDSAVWFRIEHEYVRTERRTTIGGFVEFGSWSRPRGDTTLFVKNLVAILFPSDGATACVFQPAINERCQPVPGLLYISIYYCQRFPMCREINVQEVLKGIDPSVCGDTTP